ncbi:MAG: hypothetical protein N3G21_07870 [Candidatus Hydrogenedentes bacterium]|nr:hypothetical protein [Candidatus Hydrogenedentota bacterium]
MKTIYVISPHRLQDYIVNWKVFFAGELFSAFALRGYKVIWIQPGAKWSFNIFPHFQRVWKFTVVELGNFYLFRHLVIFFISRLLKVTKEKKPIIVFELVDGDPLEIQMDSNDLILFPVIFNLSEKWGIPQQTPTPVFFVDGMVDNSLKFRGKDVNMVFLPWGFYKGVKEPCREWKINKVRDGDDKLVILLDRKYYFGKTSIDKRLKKRNGGTQRIVLWRDLWGLSLEERVLFIDYLLYLSKQGSGLKVICGKDFGHLVYQLSLLGIESWGLTGEFKEFKFYSSGVRESSDIERIVENDLISESIGKKSCSEIRENEILNPDCNRPMLSWEDIMRDMIEPLLGFL